MSAFPLNPWVDLPSVKPFVLADDLPFVKVFNRSAKPDDQLQNHLMPEPFMGRRDAPLVVLLLNPGVGTRDRSHHAQRAFASAIRADIASSSPDRHFHLCDPTQGPGHDWWVRATRSLVESVGIDVVGRNLLSIEYSAYHSRKFGHGMLRLPSQQYAFWMLEQAMARNALIVCLRGYREWLGALPSLGSYKKVLLPKSPRVSALSEANFPGKFGKMVQALRSD